MVNPEDARTLASLAKRLGTSPRRVVLAAARMACHPESDARAQLVQLRRDRMHRNVRMDELAEFLLTSPTSVANDDLAKVLRLLWQGSS